MPKYRIVEHHPRCFEPQIWRWWWPIWSALHMCSYTGHDWSPLSCTTRTEAEDLIRMHITTVRVAPVVHDYPPNPTDHQAPASGALVHPVVGRISENMKQNPDGSYSEAESL